jgi:uncharacterized phage protein (TIGR01671 family)
MRDIKFREWDFGVKGIRSAGWTYLGYIGGHWQGTIYSEPHESQGEYTGLKDKNGKEIYEGDIVDSTARYTNDKAVIEYQEYDCSFIGNRKGYAENLSMCWVSKYAEVIGNIYENPELLK